MTESECDKGNGRIQKTPKIDVEKCLDGEDLLNSFFILRYDPLGETLPRQSSSIMNKIAIYHCLDAYIADGSVKPQERGVLDHLYLGLITRRTLAREEFNTAYADHPCLEPEWEESVWQHNAYCPIAFIYLYQEISDILSLIQDDCWSDSERTKAACQAPLLVKILDAFRHNFPYCLDCDYDAPRECQYWEQVVKVIQAFQGDGASLAAGRRLRDVFTQVEKFGGAIPCRIPKQLPLNGVEGEGE